MNSYNEKPDAAEDERSQKNEGKPLAERELTEEKKIDFLEFRAGNDELKTAGDEYIEYFRNVMDELCDERNTDALRWKAYACYGNGKFPYERDWEASTECLLALMETAPYPMS